MDLITRVALFAVLLLTPALESAGQTITVTPFVGGTHPRSGEMVMYVPRGFPFNDTVPATMRFSPGMTLGAIIDLDRAGPLDLAALLTINLAERRAYLPNGTELISFSRTSSQIYALALMATSKKLIGRGNSFHIGLGPEFAYFGGEAISNEGQALPPYIVVVRPRVVVGGVGIVGWSVATKAGAVFRVQAGYRYHAPTYETQDPSDEPTVEHGSKPLQDLLITMGAMVRLRGDRPGG